MTDQPHLFSTCAYCNGRVVAQQGVLGEYTHGRDDRGVWLHMEAADWIDDPHDAEPVVDDAQELVDRIAAYWQRVRTSR